MFSLNFIPVGQTFYPSDNTCWLQQSHRLQSAEDLTVDLHLFIEAADLVFSSVPMLTEQKGPFLSSPLAKELSKL